MSQIPNYYVSSGILFKECEITPEYQEQAHKVMAMAASLLNADQDVKQHFHRWHTTRSNFNVVLSPLVDPTFWLTVSLMSHSSGGGCGNLNFGNCGGSGEGCVIVLLIALIVAVAAAIFAALGFTIKQGLDADEIRQTRHLAEQEKNRVTHPDIQNAIDQMLPLLSDVYTDRILKTLFTAILTIGLGILSASAGFAIYAMANHLPFSAWTQVLAIGGGATVGAGILAHTIRYIAAESRKDLVAYTDLFNEMSKLQPLLAHPYEALSEAEEERAYVDFNGEIYIKDNKDKFRKIPFRTSETNELNQRGYARKVFMNADNEVLS